MGLVEHSQFTQETSHDNSDAMCFGSFVHLFTSLPYVTVAYTACVVFIFVLYHSRMASVTTRQLYVEQG